MTNYASASGLMQISAEPDMEQVTNHDFNFMQTPSSGVVRTHMLVSNVPIDVLPAMTGCPNDLTEVVVGVTNLSGTVPIDIGFWSYIGSETVDAGTLTYTGGGLPDFAVGNATRFNANGAHPWTFCIITNSGVGNNGFYAFQESVGNNWALSLVLSDAYVWPSGAGAVLEPNAAVFNFLSFNTIRLPPDESTIITTYVYPYGAAPGIPTVSLATTGLAATANAIVSCFGTVGTIA